MDWGGSVDFRGLAGMRDGGALGREVGGEPETALELVWDRI